MRDLSNRRMPRRLALKRGALGLAAGAVGAWLPRSAGAQTQLVTVSGGGVNLKEMPGADGGVVELRESFSFDAHYAQCIIEDNPTAIAMETYTMGRAVIEAHAFFMAMYSNEMSLVSVREGPGDTRVARLTGQLGCATYAGTSAVAFGSRTALEPAFFEIEAVDAGHGGGEAGDSFAFTVYFEPDHAPLNYAIFGPNPTFTGELVAGEITIDTPVVRPLLA